MGVIDYFQRKIKEGASALLHDVKKEVRSRINFEIRKIEKRIVKEIVSLVFILLGVIFLSGAVVYFFSEYLQLSRALSFFIVGIFLVLAGGIVHAFK